MIVSSGAAERAACARASGGANRTGGEFRLDTAELGALIDVLRRLVASLEGELTSGETDHSHPRDRDRGPAACRHSETPKLRETETSRTDGGATGPDGDRSSETDRGMTGSCANDTDMAMVDDAPNGSTGPGTGGEDRTGELGPNADVGPFGMLPTVPRSFFELPTVPGFGVSTPPSNDEGSSNDQDDGEERDMATTDPIDSERTSNQPQTVVVLQSESGRDDDDGRQSNSDRIEAIIRRGIR